MGIYADNAATTKLDIDAFEAMKPFLLEEYANASQPYSFSRKVKNAIKESRKIIAECINAEPENIYFTSGGTESDNWAIKCFYPQNCIKHIATSQIEHHAILNACKDVSESGFCDVYYLPVNRYGVIEAENLQSFIERPRDFIATCDTTLVSIMLANNEIGTIEPIKELTTITNGRAIFHTDAVQAVGHIPIDVKHLGVDMLSASAHKFNGPKGIGFLYCKNNMIQPFHNGGLQEFGMRAGTENVASIVGMAVALRKNIEYMHINNKHLNRLTNLFLNTLNDAKVDYILNGHPTNRLSGNINISIRGKNGESLMHLLDLKNIYISTGSACDSINTKVSHVIEAININEDYRKGTIRITFGKDNTEEEVLKIAQTLIKIINL